MWGEHAFRCINSVPSPVECGAVFECCGVSVWLRMRGASHTLLQNLLVLQVRSDVKIVYPRRPASSGHISACCAPSGNTHAHTDQPLCYIVYDTDSLCRLVRGRNSDSQMFCAYWSLYRGLFNRSSLHWQCCWKWFTVLFAFKRFSICTVILEVSLLSLNNAMVLFITNDNSNFY